MGSTSLKWNSVPLSVARVDAREYTSRGENKIRRQSSSFSLLPRAVPPSLVHIARYHGHRLHQHLSPYSSFPAIHRHEHISPKPPRDRVRSLLPLLPTPRTDATRIGSDSYAKFFAAGALCCTVRPIPLRLDARSTSASPPTSANVHSSVDARSDHSHRSVLSSHQILSPTDPTVVSTDVIKTRIQLEPALSRLGMIGAGKSIIKSEGYAGLMTGFGPTAVGYLVQGGAK